MVVAQDGAAYDGQVRVGAHEVMGELFHKVQQLTEGGAVDFHGHMLAVEDDAVLFIVDVHSRIRLMCAVSHMILTIGIVGLPTYHALNHLWFAVPVPFSRL